MKGIILYRSQYGSTEQYARWLAKDMKLPLMKLEQAREQDIQSYGLIIIGSNIKVGHIQAAEWIKEHWGWLKEKRLLLFTCSGSYADAEEQKKMLENSLPAEIKDAFQYFPLPGRLNKDELSFWDRVIVFLGSKTVPDPAARERMKHGFDYVDQEQLAQLREVVKRFKQVLI
ncbi:MAG: hypothetical protein J5I94_11175 [Phaeodactylibacter sp.]|nr:hypothetical protein [Phaeodactylibacter sp.]